MDYQFWAITIIVLSITYVLFIKPRLKKIGVFTDEQLEYIDFVVDQSILKAQELYNADDSVDVEKIALDFAFDLLRETKTIPEKYFNVVEMMIIDLISQKKQEIIRE